jgi:tripartite-type tricarboxylate transporter receptor subunit TctC
MSADLVERINLGVRKAMSTVEAKADLRKYYVETEDWDAATFNRYIQSQIENWRVFIKSDANK